MALVAGAVSATGFAPLDLWPVTIAAFALWMWLVAEAPDLRAALARGWCFGVGHFTVGMNWIAGSFRFQDTMPVWLGWVAVVVLALYLAVYPAMAAGLAWRWGTPSPLRGEGRVAEGERGEGIEFSTSAPLPGASRLSLSPQGRGNLVYVLIFAAGWIVTEYLRATLFTGFAWNPLGVIWVGTPVAALVQWIGTYALSGLTALGCGLFVIFAQHLWHEVRSKPLTPVRIVALIAFFILPELVAIALVPILFASEAGAMTDPARPRVLVIQPNIGQQTKHDDSFDELNWSKLSSLTGPPGDKPRLILWPEAAVPYFLEEERWAVDRIARLMGPKDMLLTGGDAFVWDKAGKNIVAAHNAVFAVSPMGQIKARYDKAHLVPYGEYLPMRPLLSAIGLNRLVPGDLDFWPGPGPRTLNVAGFGKVGVQVCYEIIFSGEVVDAKNRPDFIFNPSNDAWFGSWGSPQFVAQSRLRAIEEGLPVIRATPTGISAVIDSNGAVRVALPTGKAGVIQTTLPAPAPPTLFARLGHIMTALCVLTLIGFAVALRRWQR
jgi:apolipoprotein N-acyltransferase